jgi:hypothetical protein
MWLPVFLLTVVQVFHNEMFQTKIIYKFVVSILYPEDTDSRFSRNISKVSLNYTAHVNVVMIFQWAIRAIKMYRCVNAFGSSLWTSWHSTLYM